MLKTSFHVINILLIIFYLYPGSILGCYFYNDCNIQPSLTKDFIISSNHFFVFLIFGLIAFIAFSKEKKIIIIRIFYFYFFRNNAFFYSNQSIRNKRFIRKSYWCNNIFDNI